MSDEHGSTRADEVVDELLPIDFDWRRLVRAYPIPALAVAVAGGFFIGRRHGAELVSAATALVTEEVTRNVHSLLETTGGRAPDEAGQS
ncbi:MAG TPA: hypothetical protein VGG06_00855 [Thermoanaerobaculia bacterium]|jgi:hypothetical protein